MAQLGKNPSGNAGEARDTGAVPVLGGSPGGGNDNPLQYACLENSMNRSAWWATFHRVTKSRTQLCVCMNAHRGQYTYFNLDTYLHNVLQKNEY